MARPLNFAAAVVISAVFGWFAAGPAGLCAEEIAARQAGDLASAEATESEAKAATQSIVSRLSQVWMFSDLALGHARAGKRAVAETALDRGLEVARDLDNAWGRARALVRLATVLVEIADPHPYLPIEPAQ